MEEMHQEVEAVPHAEHAAQMHESIGVPSFDLTKVLPEGGAISPLAATLGGLAIVGGVALKVIPSWLRGRTEMATQRLALKAKRMELEQKTKEQQQSGDCVSRHAACLAAIAALEERLKLVEKQADGLMGEVAAAKDQATKLSLTGRGSVDEDRLHALEKCVAELSSKVGKTDPE